MPGERTYQIGVGDSLKRMVVLQVSTDFDPVWFFFSILSVYVCGTHIHITCVYELEWGLGGAECLSQSVSS